MKKHYTLAMVFFDLSLDSAIAQPKQPIDFTCAYAKANDSDNIRLTARNHLSDKTFYYAISVAGLTDTGWVVLNSDINSIGQNDFLVLKPLRPNSADAKYVSKKKILFIYAYYKPKRIRFSLMYHKKLDFKTEGKVIDSPPL
jgi:hypothetical protein